MRPYANLRVLARFISCVMGGQSAAVLFLSPMLRLPGVQARVCTKQYSDNAEALLEIPTGRAGGVDSAMVMQLGNCHAHACPRV